MAEHVLSNGLIMFEGIDLTTQLNQVSIDLSAEALDRTDFSDTTRKRVGGLKTAAISAAGFFGAAEPDASLFADLGGADKLITVAATTVEGDIAYFLRSLVSEYAPLDGNIGDLAGFSLVAGANLGDLIRGTIGHNNTQTATGNATGRQLGAIAAGQSIYVGTHITAFNGTSVQIIIQSDDNSGFTSATDRITFSAATAIGSQFASLAGAVTDDWWRVRYVVIGTSFTFTTTFGIQ